MEETGYAKINLALHVRERRPDGYHELDTLFAFVEHGDRLRVSESDRLRLEVEGPFASSLVGDNLVLRAAEALQARFDVDRGAALLLDKRLPVASGIGGGSADAAAALRLLVRWWALDIDPADLLQIAAGLGADVTACLGSLTAFGTGRGDELVAVDASTLSGMPLLLVNPRVPVSTAKIFQMWDGVDRGPLGTGSPVEAALQGRNDLEAPAISIAPKIRDVLLALRQCRGVILARMSGSGATCFALFEHAQERDRAAERIAADHPGWWTLTTCLR